MSTNDTTNNIPADDESAACKSRNLAPAPGSAPVAVSSASIPTQPGNAPVASTSNHTTQIQNNMNTNNYYNVPADDESAALPVQLNHGVMPFSASPFAEGEERVYEPGEVIYTASRNYRQTSCGSAVHMADFADEFVVPLGGARAEASLSVDDWGMLTISGPGGDFSIDLSTGQAGPYGGH